MECRFVVEAKHFFFSTKDSKLRLEERRKGFVGLILVGHRCASWLAATVEEASSYTEKEEFAKNFCEERNSLSVSGGRNKAGRFLEVVTHVDGERKGVIWIPEARSGRGWRRFGVELRSWLASVVSYPGSPECAKLGEGSSGSQASSSEEEEAGSTDSFSDGERTPFRGLQELVEVDLLPGVNRFELGNEDRRAALDCYAVEKDSSLCMAGISLSVETVASVKRKKMKKRLGLGFCGLGPNNKGKRASTGWRKKWLGLGFGFFCLGLGLGKLGVGLGLVPGPVGLVPGLVSGPGSGSVEPVTGSDTGSSGFSHLDSSEVSLESSTVVDVQIRPEDASSAVVGFSDASSPGFDDQNRLVGADSSVPSSGESEGDGSGSSVAGGVRTGRDSISVVHSSGTPLVSEGGLELGVTAALNSGHWPSSVESPLLSVQVLDESTSAQGDGPVGDGSSSSVDSSESQPVPESQPLVNGLTEAQAWFFGWMRHGGRHHEKLLAAVDRFEKQTRKDNEVAPPPDCSMELPQMKAVLEAAMRDVDSGVITTEAGSKIGTDIGVRVGCL